MICSRAAKQTSASAIGMMTISAAVKLSPNDDRGDRGAAVGLAMGGDSVVIAPPRRAGTVSPSGALSCGSSYSMPWP